jgi:pilus assembly protein CpaC
MSKSRINMNVSTEVSNVSNDLSLNLGGGLTIPGFDVRRAETSVELPSGGTLMLAGLLESKTINNISQIPGVKNIPIIGDLTSSESFRREETELVIMISAYLVNPLDDQSEVANAEEIVIRDPLTQAYLDNLKLTYGETHIMNALSNNSSIGYIVD